MVSLLSDSQDQDHVCTVAETECVDDKKNKNSVSSDTAADVSESSVMRGSRITCTSISSLQTVLGKERLQRLMQNLRDIDVDLASCTPRHDDHLSAADNASRQSRPDIAQCCTADDRKQVASLGLAVTSSGSASSYCVHESSVERYFRSLRELHAQEETNKFTNNTSCTDDRTTTGPGADDDDDDESMHGGYSAAVQQSFRARVDSIKRSLLHANPHDNNTDILFTRVSRDDLELSREGRDLEDGVNVRDSENFVYEDSEEDRKRATLAGIPDALREQLQLHVSLTESIDASHRKQLDVMTSQHAPRDSVTSAANVTDSLTFDYVDLSTGGGNSLPEELRQELRLDLRGWTEDLDVVDQISSSSSSSPCSEDSQTECRLDLRDCTEDLDVVDRTELTGLNDELKSNSQQSDKQPPVYRHTTDDTTTVVAATDDDDDVEGVGVDCTGSINVDVSGNTPGHDKTPPRSTYNSRSCHVTNDDIGMIHGDTCCHQSSHQYSKSDAGAEVLKPVQSQSRPHTAATATAAVKRKSVAWSGDVTATSHVNHLSNKPRRRPASAHVGRHIGSASANQRSTCSSADQQNPRQRSVSRL